MKAKSTTLHTLLSVMVLSAFPLVPDTTQAKSPSIYPNDGQGMARVEQALVRAQIDNKRVLLKIGGDWCGWCHKLHDVFNKDQALRSLLRDEYVLVMIENQADKAVLEKWNIHPDGYPYLAVLDASGTKLTEQETGSLEIGPRHDPAKVKAFLDKWTPVPWDARTLLEQSLSTAKKEDKQVFFRVGAPTCGWCVRLDQCLARPGVRTTLERDFVILKIDVQRMTGGREVAEQVRQTTSGGIPWFAFLAPDGRVLQTSNNAQGNNIGFPVRPDTEIRHFRNMLMGARKHMTPDDVTSVIEELKLFTKPWQ